MAPIFPPRASPAVTAESPTGDQTQDTRSMSATGSFDGSAKFMSARDLIALAGGATESDAGPVNPATPLPNPLWCNPASPQGLPTKMP